jgi:hypothetical protein
MQVVDMLVDHFAGIHDESVGRRPSEARHLGAGTEPRNPRRHRQIRK